jgi:hypothetical protein
VSAVWECVAQGLRSNIYHIAEGGLMRIRGGIDWSERHHDVTMMNAVAVLVARARRS